MPGSLLNTAFENTPYMEVMRFRGLLKMLKHPTLFTFANHSPLCYLRLRLN